MKIPSLKKRTQKSGFTLLELLVVISIIGILMALSVVAFSTAQKKGRDARRRADVKAMAAAFEQYYADNNSIYTNACSSLSTYITSGTPVDPKNSGSYVYAYSCTASTYCISALLEETGKGNCSVGSPTCTLGAGNYACAKNQQ